LSLSFILNLTGSKRAALQFFFSLILFLQGFHVFLSPPIAHASPFQRMAVALLPVPFYGTTEKIGGWGVLCGREEIKIITVEICSALSVG
jgi:hypothetical protein